MRHANGDVPANQNACCPCRGYLPLTQGKELDDGTMMGSLGRLVATMLYARQAWAETATCEADTLL